MVEPDVTTKTLQFHKNPALFKIVALHSMKASVRSYPTAGTNTSVRTVVGHTQLLDALRKPKEGDLERPLNIRLTHVTLRIHKLECLFFAFCFLVMHSAITTRNP